MSRLGVLVILGSRPEAIKLAPVVRVLRAQPDTFRTVLCSTGQQLQMTPQALAEFGIEVDIDLQVMSPDQTLASLTARLIGRLDETLVDASPDCTIVQGDTTSAMTGALCSFYRRIPVAHVEAGMRTHNIFSPFPEEANRRIITQCASLHLAPTGWCRDNLVAEGVSPERICVTGNTVVDALHAAQRQILGGPSRLPVALDEAMTGRRVLLVTTHRRENFDGGLSQICEAIERICAHAADVLVVLPVHPNPRVQETVIPRLRHHGQIRLVEPLAYRTFLEVMARAHLVLTDSGGLQEEAPSFGKPVLVLRDTTERPEGIEAGVAQLIGTRADDIVAATVRMLDDDRAYAQAARAQNPYGDGRAAPRIAAAITRFFDPSAHSGATAPSPEYLVTHE